MRKGILILLLMALTSGALAEEMVCISVEGITALLTADGRETVTPGQYDDAFTVREGELYALGLDKETGMRYALCDADGQVLTKFLYTMFQSSGGAVLFRQDGLYGAMDGEGNVLIPAEYTQLITDDGVHYLAMRTDPFDDEPDQIYRVTAGAEPKATGVATDEGLKPLSDGRTSFQDRNTERFGYLDARGNVALEAVYDAAGDFQNGIARASLDGKLGLIDPDGRWKAEPKYDYLEVGDGVIVGLVGREIFEVLSADTFACILREEGEALNAAVVGSHPILYRDGKLIAYHRDGSLWRETEAYITLTEGLDGQLILSTGSWGSECVSLVTPDGEVMNRRDQHVLPLSDGRYAFIRMDAAAYYSDLLGEIRHSCDYDTLRWGMMDGEGNSILPAQYSEIRALGAQRFLTVTARQLQMVDPDGKVLWQYERTDEGE